MKPEPFAKVKPNKAKFGTPIELLA